MIQQQDLAIFLKNIRQNSSSSMSLNRWVIKLIRSSENILRIEIKNTSFQHLLSSVLEEPYILEDEAILRNN